MHIRCADAASGMFLHFWDVDIYTLAHMCYTWVKIHGLTADLIWVVEITMANDSRIGFICFSNMTRFTVLEGTALRGCSIYT